MSPLLYLAFIAVGFSAPSLAQPRAATVQRAYTPREIAFRKELVRRLYADLSLFPRGSSSELPVPKVKPLTDLFPGQRMIKADFVVAKLRRPGRISTLQLRYLAKVVNRRLEIFNGSYPELLEQKRLVMNDIDRVLKVIEKIKGGFSPKIYRDLRDRERNIRAEVRFATKAVLLARLRERARVYAKEVDSYDESSPSSLHAAR
jgi:hypothetical protein